MNDNRVSSDELAKAIIEFSKHIPPISEQDISMVKINPSLSLFQSYGLSEK